MRPGCQARSRRCSARWAQTDGARLGVSPALSSPLSSQRGASGPGSGKRAMAVGGGDSVVFILLLLLLGVFVRGAPLETLHHGGQKEAGDDGSDGYGHAGEDDDEQVREREGEPALVEAGLRQLVQEHPPVLQRQRALDFVEAWKKAGRTRASFRPQHGVA